MIYIIKLSCLKIKNIFKEENVVNCKGPKFDPQYCPQNYMTKWHKGLSTEMKTRNGSMKSLMTWAVQQSCCLVPVGWRLRWADAKGEGITRSSPKLELVLI